MIQRILKKYIRQGVVRNGEDRKHIVRSCSLFGIFLNLLLFAGKLAAGLLSGSIAVFSDAFNNLSDAGSSLVVLLGIKLAMKKPDPEHPFGHGRLEYLLGLAVSVVIILTGLELGKESIQKILRPSSQNGAFFWLSFIVLSISVLIKVYMWYYNRKFGAITHCATMTATALDSLSDAAATSAVWVTTVFTKLFNLPYLDGICGVVVSCFILYTGYRAARETLIPLLGQQADPELVREMKAIVMTHPEILGIHDLVIHDYGPGRLMATLHAEVQYDAKLWEIHNVIDEIEQELMEKLFCETVIHLDPVNDSDPETLALRSQLSQIISENFPEITFHDFHVISGSNPKITFDLSKPFSCKISDEDIVRTIQNQFQEKNEKLSCVIHIDDSHSIS